MKLGTMLYAVFDLNWLLAKTMKGADKAIVAKSFGKWKSGSLRSSTMEKPDEPSEESHEEVPQLGTKPVGGLSVLASAVGGLLTRTLVCSQVECVTENAPVYSFHMLMRVPVRL
ncbi:unnamed protein product [Knipowitschia caucasica]